MRPFEVDDDGYACLENRAYSSDHDSRHPSPIRGPRQPPSSRTRPPEDDVPNWEHVPSIDRPRGWQTIMPPFPPEEQTLTPMIMRVRDPDSGMIRGVDMRRSPMFRYATEPGRFPPRSPYFEPLWDVHRAQPARFDDLRKRGLVQGGFLRRRDTPDSGSETASNSTVSDWTGSSGSESSEIESSESY